MNENSRAVAAVVGVVALAGPRRTRPLAAFLYGAALSRAHGAARERTLHQIGDVIGRLFDERTSVGARVDDLELRVDDVEDLGASQYTANGVEVRPGHEVGRDALLRIRARSKARPR